MNQIIGKFGKFGKCFIRTENSVAELIMFIIIESMTRRDMEVEGEAAVLTLFQIYPVYT